MGDPLQGRAELTFGPSDGKAFEPQSLVVDRARPEIGLVAFDTRTGIGLAHVEVLRTRLAGMLDRLRAQQVVRTRIAGQIAVACGQPTDAVLTEAQRHPDGDRLTPVVSRP